MNIKKLSTNGIKAMHQAAYDRLLEEDQLPLDAPRSYGVREHADWRLWVDELEAELTARREAFTPVPW